MGYRSDVAIGLTDHATRLLHAIATHEDSELCQLLQDAQGGWPGKSANIAKDPSDQSVVLYWESIKWYDDFPEISMMKNFLESIPPSNYRFIRLGEENDDTEEHGDYYDAEIWITRSISWG